MSSSGLPDVVFAGPPKSASTWLYECLRDHPEVSIHPGTDSLNFFDVNYHCGVDWYSRQFGETEDRTVFETTTTYLYSKDAAERIHDHLEEPTIVFNLRNPVDRAFSHWWHGKSKGYWDYEFAEALEQYPPYQMWIEPGFYASHLDRFSEYFDDDQLQVLFFDDLVADDKAFVQDVFAVAGVDDTYVPSQIDEKSNTAHAPVPGALKTIENIVASGAPEAVKDAIRPVWMRTRGLLEEDDQYEEGMDPTVKAELERIYAPDTKRLSERTGRDLDHWFEHVDLDDVEPIAGEPSQPRPTRLS